LSVTAFERLRFGDVQAVKLGSYVIPDVVLAVLPQGAPDQDEKHLVAVGELKTWWMVFLEHYYVTSPMEQHRMLENHVGKSPKTAWDSIFMAYTLHRTISLIHAKTQFETRVLIDIQVDCLCEKGSRLPL
jgi:hypothetical protein